MNHAPDICDGGLVRIRVSALTDRGLVRAQNEDSFGWWLPEDPEDCRRRGLVIAVADGMGGARGGEVASRLAIDAVLRSWRESPGESPAEELRAALAAANRAVHHESLVRPGLGGMGTTCTAAAVREGAILLAHVGDSRAYLVRGGRIRQLTHDHSLVSQLVRERQITPEQARTDPRRNVVTRGVGIGPEVEIDVGRTEETLEPGDTLVLCTDGLHGQVSDEELAAAASGPDLERGCGALVALARERGGPDNITLILARAESTDGGSAPPAAGNASAHAGDWAREAPRSPAGGRRALVVILLLGLLGLLLAVAWWLSTRRPLRV